MKQDISQCLSARPSMAVSVQRSPHVHHPAAEQNFADALTVLSDHIRDDVESEPEEQEQVSAVVEQVAFDEPARNQSQFVPWLLRLPQLEGATSSAVIDNGGNARDQKPPSPSSEQCPPLGPVGTSANDQPQLPKVDLPPHFAEDFRHHTPRQPKPQNVTSNPIAEETDHASAVRWSDEVESANTPIRETKCDSSATETQANPTPMHREVTAQVSLGRHTPAPAGQQILTLIENFSSLERTNSIREEHRTIGGGEIKVLRLTLKPEDLGEVEITLRRSSGEVKIHIVATRKETAQVLQNDIGFLEDRLGVVLPSASSPTVAITVTVPDQSGSAGALREQYWGGSSTMADHGHQTDAGGGQSSSRKDDAPSRMRRHRLDDEDISLQPSAADRIV